tara:strand:+ start:319 stop:543 length:225 start_codon:yes stop_codon:yes gene_type:complete
MNNLELKVGDLVTWAPDGDVGIVTRIDQDEQERAVANLNPQEDYEPYYIRWFKDPKASGWHGTDDGMLFLLNSI